MVAGRRHEMPESEMKDSLLSIALAIEFQPVLFQFTEPQFSHGDMAKAR